MKRREFVRLLGATAAVWPLVARAQQPDRVFRIGVVEPISAELNAANLAAFRRGLQELGYVEGRNLILHYRSAGGDASRFPGLISELIGLNVDLIVTRGTPAALAAKKATSTIPVVMAGLGEPLLVVKSLARPGGNIHRPERNAAGPGTQTTGSAPGDGSGDFGNRRLSQHEQPG